MRFKIHIYLLPLLLIMACNKSEYSPLQNGDLLFLSYSNGELSGAIDEVTQTQKATHYAHMALVQISGRDTFVFHASSKKGVVKEKIASFIKDESASQIDIYRLKETLQINFSKAFVEAEKHVGLPYNSAYLWVDTTYYCSQFIYAIFESDSIFQLDPMTFKDPTTGEFHPDWIKHYEKLGLPIPEGDPGCNPNGMAASKNLQFIGTLKLP